MPIKTYRPVTPTRRFQTVTTRDDITRQTPEKSLVESKQRSGGRNSTGRVTSRFIGGGAKKAYRVVDFKRDKLGIPAVVASIEYDPNRSARIALLNYADGEKRYIIHPDGLKVGQKLMSGPEAPSGSKPSFSRTHAAASNPSLSFSCPGSMTSPGCGVAPPGFLTLGV